jgi:hypothetical protein
MIFFKKSTIVLDCFTHRKEVYEFAPIKNIRDSIPKWWKNLPHLKNANCFETFTRNMRSCPGFLRTFDSGFVIPLWSDLQIEIGRENESNYRWQFSDLKSSASEHPPEQWGDFVDSTKYQHIKLNTPWLLKTKNKCGFMWVGAQWHGIGLDDLDGMHVVNGVDEYYYQHSTTINMLFRRKLEEKLYHISFGQDLVYGIPLSDKKVIIKTHLISKSEYDNIDGSDTNNLFFNRSYYKTRKLIDSKCPRSKM